MLWKAGSKENFFVLETDKAAQILHNDTSC